MGQSLALLCVLIVSFAARALCGPQQSLARLCSGYTSLITAIGSTIFIVAHVSGAAVASAMEAVVVFVPCVAFSVELGIASMSLRQALHHVLGIAGTTFVVVVVVVCFKALLD